MTPKKDSARAARKVVTFVDELPERKRGSGGQAPGPWHGQLMDHPGQWAELHMSPKNCGYLKRRYQEDGFEFAVRSGVLYGRYNG